MRKIILSLLCLTFVVSATSAQELVSRKGYKILPQAGDIALGLDASPLLNYLGSVMEGAGAANNAVTGMNNAIYLKYFLDEQTALRASLSFRSSDIIDRGVVKNDTEVANNPNNPDAKTIDVHNIISGNLNLNVGYEKRRGHGRVQGFYGAQAGFGYSYSRDTYDFGNQMTVANQTPTTSWGQLAGTEREIKSVDPTTYNVNLGGFVGVEYFFAPQISLAGELGLAGVYNWNTRSSAYETTNEFYNSSTNAIEEKTIRTTGSAKGANNSVATKTTANIALLFHF